jgi:DNA helicase-2/ATP-dependent DNA helicase PcrA
LEDLEQLAEFAGRQGALADFLSELALVAGVAAEAVLPGEPPDEHVTLTTIHQAKGL